MTDATQTPAPGTDTGVATQTDQTSQAQTTPAGQPAENQQETQPQFVTKDDLALFGKTLAQQLKQSDRDRTKRIEGEINNLKELVSKSGIEINAQQEAALRSQIADRLEQEDGAPSQDLGGEISQPGEPVTVDTFVRDVFAEVGTQVTPQDPEWADLKKVVDETWNDPKGAIKVMTAATRAAQKKAARTATNQEAAAARVSSGGVSNAGNNTLDPNAPASSFWKEAYKK